jgi:hypothetical protein
MREADYHFKKGEYGLTVLYTGVAALDVLTVGEAAGITGAVKATSAETRLLLGRTVARGTREEVAQGVTETAASGLEAGGQSFRPVQAVKSVFRQGGSSGTVFVEKYVTDEAQTLTHKAAASVESGSTLGIDLSALPVREARTVAGHIMEIQVEGRIGSHQVLGGLLEHIPHNVQSRPGAMLGDFRLKQPFSHWNLKEWDVTTPGSAWGKMLRGYDRNWLTYQLNWSSIRKPTPTP